MVDNFAYELTKFDIPECIVKEKWKPKCESCKACCRIEGWSHCWDLCTCECHNIVETKPQLEEIDER